jgi:hypothetical protein
MGPGQAGEAERLVSGDGFGEIVRTIAAIRRAEGKRLMYRQPLDK